MKSLIVIISNPLARGSSVRKILQASAYLQKRGFATDVLCTEKKDHATDLARKAVKSAPYCIIAAGGDGTINEVLNGMIRSETPLAILPLGTSNVLAKELSIPESVDGAMERIVSGRLRTVSLGKVRALTGTASISRYFSLMAGIGFDAMAVLGADRNIKKISGEGAYILSGISNLIRYSPDELHFTIDSAVYSGYSAIIGKAGRYGGHFRVTPDADIHDPSFYLCIFKGRRRIDLLRYAAGVILGSHLRQSDIIYLQAREIGVSGHAHIQIDGDYLGTTPAEISIEKDALNLVY
jgi:YegS/Rv2252/BmrU family lipid kinase